MTFQRSEAFRREYRRLPRRERNMFLLAVRAMNAAYADRGERAKPAWPASLRVKSLQGYPGIWEMTWSFAGPDGRATFELVDIDGELGIEWRRIGGHGIFRHP